MPRRREIAKREVPADPIYDSPLVTKFISTIMRGGKRSTAERIMYKALDIVKEKTPDDPLKVFKKAIDNVKPSLEVKSRRVGGSNYQVPVEVNPNRRLSLAHPLGRRATRASAATARRCRRSWRTSSSTPPTCAAAPSRSAKTRTAWPKPTRRSRTTAGNAELTGRQSRLVNGSYRSARSLSQHRHHGPHRCRQDDDDRAHPVLHRHHLQDR